MTDPISGTLGALVLSGWVAEAPTGRDEAFLLLATPDRRAAVTMPVVADALGLTGPPGSPVTSPEAYVAVGADGWITLHAPGGERLQHPGVLVVGTAPMPAGTDPDTHTDRHGDGCRIGIVPLRSG